MYCVNKDSRGEINYVIGEIILNKV